jgi:hypothetical protein
MTTTLRVILIIIILIIGYYGIKLLTYDPTSQCKVIYLGEIDHFEDLSKINKTVFQTSGDVNGFDFNVDGFSKLPRGKPTRHCLEKL